MLLLAAASAVGAAQAQPQLALESWAQTGNAAFVGVILEGGGRQAKRDDTVEGVIEVEAVMPTRRQALEPSPRIGRQRVMFRAFHIHDPRVTTFETPPDGSRIIGFGKPDAPPDGMLLVYADAVFADSPQNRAAFGIATRAYEPDPWQTPLFLTALGLAVLATFAVWIRPKAGVVLLGGCLASWAGYESRISPQTNIRVDLLVLIPVVAVAALSVAVAWSRRFLAQTREG